jgi:outer membrane protein
VDKFALARENMIKGQILPNKIVDEALIKSMSEIQRHSFIPEHFKHVAYCDEHIKVGKERYSLSPVVFSQMVQAVGISKNDSVLDVACGTGYSSAILSRLAKKVVAIESESELASKANLLLKSTNIGNAIILNNKLSYGCPESAPYDVIFINGAVKNKPQTLIEQLKDGGKLVVVMKKNDYVGVVTVFTKQNNTTTKLELFDAMVPVLKIYKGINILIMFKTKNTLLSASLVLSLVSFDVRAAFFEDALSMAYNNNPALKAAREDVKSTDEQMPQAISGFLPNVVANVQQGKRNTDQGATSDDQTTGTKEIAITQPLFRGGQTYNRIKQAENTIFAARERLKQIEQDVLLEAITAYADIIRDKEVLDLSKNNVEVLQKNLDVTTERFGLGEVTKTDVAQAEASLAVAKSEQINADGVLKSSEATYTRIIGEAPNILEPIKNPFDIQASLDEMIQIAMEENPSLKTASYSEIAAKSEVRVEKGALLPRVDLRASKDEQKGVLFSSSDLENERVSINLSIPLYQSGAEYSSVRQAKFNHGRLKSTLDDQKNKVREAVIEAFNNFHVAKAVIESNKSAIQASEIALNGTREEAKFGARTTLDVLNAEQDLFEAKANLIRSKRDAIVSSYRLLAFIGRLNPSQLGLAISTYNPEESYNKRKYQIIGF